jgi:hypothetical protein
MRLGSDDTVAFLSNADGSAADEPDFIAQSDQAAIGARPEQFRMIWQTISPQERQAAALARIEAARAHLRMYPASCSARTSREDAFADLYLVSEELGMSRAQVDRVQRRLEDHVFAELEYNSSKTCCWNSPTAAMASIVLGLCAARAGAGAGANGVRSAHGVSRERDGGWVQHLAQSRGDVGAKRGVASVERRRAVHGSVGGDGHADVAFGELLRDVSSLEACCAGE